MPWTLIFAIFSGVLVIVAGIAQYKEKQKDDETAQRNFASISKENNELKEQVRKDSVRREDNENTIIELSRDLADANKKLSAKSDQIIDSTNELNTAQKKVIAANEEIARLQNELFKQFAGDSTAPAVKVYTGLAYDGNIISIGLENPGNYPITNISITSMDIIDEVFKGEWVDGMFRKPRQIISASQPLTLSAYQKEYIFDRIDRIDLHDFARDFTTYYGNSLAYKIRWRNGSYLCIIRFECDTKSKMCGNFSIKYENWNGF